MTKKLIAVLILTFLIGVSCGCVENSSYDGNQNNNDDSSPNGNNNSSDDDNTSSFDYYNQYYKFGLDLPDQWIKNESVSNMIVRFSPPNESNISMILLKPYNLTAGQDLEFFSDALIYNLNSTEGIENLTVLSNESLSINQKEAYQAVYTFTKDGVDFKQKQVYILNNNKVCTITYTSREQTYVKYDGEITISIDSFTFV